MPQADVRASGLDVLARTGNPLTITLTWPAGYLTGKSFTSSIGGTSISPGIAGDVMTLALTAAQTTALGNGRHALLVTDTTGDDVVRISGRVLLGTTATDSPDTSVTVLTDTNVSVSVTVAVGIGLPLPSGTATAGRVPAVSDDDPLTLVWTDIGTQVELDAEAAARAAADTALDARLDVIEALGPLATDAEVSAAIAALSGTYVQHIGPATADDTTRINTLLNTVRLAGGGVVRGMPGEDYQISGRLIPGSNTILDLSESDLTLLPGSNTNMISNYAAQNPVATASDGAVTSGSNVVSTALGAQAVVGQGLVLHDAAGNGYGHLIGVISARTSTTITLVELDGVTPANATATVSGKTVKLVNRDTDIHIKVRELSRGANGPNTGVGHGDAVTGHSIFLKHLDHYSVDVKRGTSTAGISLIWPADTSHGDIWLHDCDTERTGVQVAGPAFDIDIHVARGTTTDDLVSIAGNAYPDQIDTSGNIRHLRIGTVDATDVGSAALRILSGQGFAIDDLLVYGQITGTAYAPILVGEDPGSNQTLGGTYGTIDFGQVTVRGTNGLLLQSNKTVAKSIKMRGHAEDLIYFTGAGVIDDLDLDMDFYDAGQPILQTLSTNVIRKMRVAGTYQTSVGSSLMSIYGSSVIYELDVDIHSAPTATALTFVNVSGSASVESVDFQTSRVKFADTSGSSYLLRVQTGATVRNAKVSGSYENGNNLIRLESGATVSAIHLDRLSGVGVGRVAVLGVACSVLVGTVFLKDNVNAPFYATATIDVYGSTVKTSGATTRIFEQGGGGAFQLWSPEIRTDLAHVTLVAGATAYNTNSATSPGVGPVVSDGTIWKLLLNPGAISAKPWQSGRYYFTPNFGSTGTSGSLGNGSMRLVPFWLPNGVTLSRIGAEVTSAGEAGSTVRLGIYADDGTGRPGTLVLDAGTINGTSATVQEITISQALTAGQYWVAAAVQGAPTTQPTLRTHAAAGIIPIDSGTSTPSTNLTNAGFVQTGVSGALPAIGSLSAAGNVPRSFVKVA